MLFVKSVPLYRKVSAKIVELINDGRFDNNILPSEESLSKMIGVSRSTVREALAELTSQGIITKRQGIGNIVMNSALKTKYRIDLKLDFADMLEEAGHKAKFIQSYSRYENLKINGKESEYYVYDELLLADDDIAAVFKIHVEKESLSVEPAVDLPKSNFFEFIFDFTNEIISHSIVYFEAEVADKLLAKRFKINEGDPILAWKEIFYTVKDEEVCINRIYFNPNIFRPTMLRNSFEPTESGAAVKCEVKPSLD